MNNLPLQYVASQLSCWEVPILQGLYRRCRAAMYPKGEDLLLQMLRQDEEGRSRVEQSDVAYRPFCQPWIMPISSAEPLIWSAAGVNFNAALLQAFRQFSASLPRLAALPGEHEHNWQVDRVLLPQLSYRIHYGAIYVSEYKYLGDRDAWRSLARKGDRAAMLQFLTRAEVERQLLLRVEVLGERLGGGLLAQAGVALYRDLIIPLTKEGEIVYLLRRAAQQA